MATSKQNAGKDAQDTFKGQSVLRRDGSDLPGTIYQNGKRWSWKVKLPGTDKRVTIPLRPRGMAHATADYSTAVIVARDIWRRALAGAPPTATTIAALVETYKGWADTHYPEGSREGERIEFALRDLVKIHGGDDPESFGPLALHGIARAMAESGRAHRTIVQRVAVIRRLFQWAVERELVPASCWHALQAVNLKGVGKRPKVITPVAVQWVERTAEHASPAIAAMIRLQLLTGMRSGEVCALRPCDIDTSGKVWFYRPSEHKTAHLGYQRNVALGPRAQAILKAFLGLEATEPVFRPGEALAAVRGKAAVGSRHGLGAVKDRYDSHSYSHGIKTAIRKARVEHPELPDWHPHQLRHAAATLIRKQFGVDAARAVLGHRSPAVTEIYAELDQTQAGRVAGEIG